MVVLIRCAEHHPLHKGAFGERIVTGRGHTSVATLVRNDNVSFGSMQSFGHIFSGGAFSHGSRDVILKVK